MNIKQKIEEHIAYLEPHVAWKITAQLLRDAVVEIERLEKQNQQQAVSYADELEKLAVEIETLCSEIKKRRQGAVNVRDAILGGLCDKGLLEMLTDLYRPQ